MSTNFTPGWPEETKDADRPVKTKNRLAIVLDRIPGIPHLQTLMTKKTRTERMPSTNTKINFICSIKPLVYTFSYIITKIFKGFNAGMKSNRGMGLLEIKYKKMLGKIQIILRISKG
ncbi:hypothetical protein [Suipraeoptans intestinalis]|uniref:hypothetical protein n=1 Tax=Suipraeoptans intestinalis TaxID=2606628 RepID=UPI001F1DDAAD|nr:hypothetical protein [Suipraeoptans intestinalis]